VNVDLTRVDGWVVRFWAAARSKAWCGISGSRSTMLWRSPSSRRC